MCNSAQHARHASNKWPHGPISGPLPVIRVHTPRSVRAGHMCGPSYCAGWAELGGRYRQPLQLQPDALGRCSEERHDSLRCSERVLREDHSQGLDRLGLASLRRPSGYAVTPTFFAAAPASTTTAAFSTGAATIAVRTIVVRHGTCYDRSRAGGSRGLRDVRRVHRPTHGPAAGRRGAEWLAAICVGRGYACKQSTAALLQGEQVRVVGDDRAGRRQSVCDAQHPSAQRQARAPFSHSPRPPPAPSPPVPPPLLTQMSNLRRLWKPSFCDWQVR